MDGGQQITTTTTEGNGNRRDRSSERKVSRWEADGGGKKEWGVKRV